MIGQAQDSYAFVVLFRGDAGVRVQQMLLAAANPKAARAVHVQLPDVRGLEFLSATGPVAAGLNAWWERSVPPNRRPVFLAMDEAGLEEWIPGTDGCWFVGVGDPERERALGALDEAVFPVTSRDAEAVAEQAMQAMGGSGALHPAFHPSFPYRQAPTRWLRVVPRLDPLNPSEDGSSPLDGVVLPSPVSESPTTEMAPPRAPVQPISYEPEPESVVAPPRPRAERAASSAVLQRPLGSRLLRRLDDAVTTVRTLLATHRRGESSPSPNLGPTINANRPIVAGFASRKGGVGKTTHAAATAATVGEALDGMPDTAALVDGNITNPDSWALNPPPDSATVRTLVSRLTMGQDPPAEGYARTPRLAIYPESRTSEELYTQAEVDLVAEYLRRRHSFIAVDLPNALPSLTSGGAGAVAAAWLKHCDVIVLPFNADPRARQGLLEYVDALQEDTALALIPVMAPYILSSNRAIASDQAVLADVAELQRRGVQVVEVPDDENALLALLQDLPINQASPGLRRAYVELSERLIATVITSRRSR